MGDKCSYDPEKVKTKQKSLSLEHQNKLEQDKKCFEYHSPTTVICPVTPTVTNPIIKMEVAHNMGHALTPICASY